MHPIENEKCPYKKSKLKKNESASEGGGLKKTRELSQSMGGERGTMDGADLAALVIIHASALNSLIDSGITE
jgi:hypothetical protein